MAAATSGSSPVRQFDPSPSDRLKSIEAKVVILGSQGVGKTSLVIRNMGGTFSENVTPTIGASFFSFNMSVAGYRVKLQVWDTAGQERFRSMAPMYYRRANAAIIVYDITSENSFIEARTWVKEVQSKVDTTIALSVIGNKSDLEDKREVTTEKGEEFAYSLGASFLETSAANNIGVREAFLQVANAVIALHNGQLLSSNTLSSTLGPLSTHSPARSLKGSYQSGNDVYLYNTQSIGHSSRIITHDVPDETEKSFCCS